MNWINAFELLCYAITAMFLWDVIRRKNREELWLFISAAIAGFALELLAVRVTDIYHYSPDFYISIGFKPYQFPFFGGLMWGGLTVYGLQIARRLKLNDFVTALVTGWLIVTMDILLDVAAIRLNGGFWVWDGREITLQITHHMFMSVIWVNFLGYMFETPVMVLISLRTAAKRDRMPVWKQLLAAIGIGVCGVAFVGAASGISLLLNAITDEWFACIAFVLLWCFVLGMIIRRCISTGTSISSSKNWEVPVLIYWTVMYGFSLAALVHLGIASAVPLYFIFSIIMFAGTLYLAIRE
ncbi:MAG: DUF422 domain-containing protein [Clostridia bacterium]|jgi:hypothetical protein|nr:DUF422 domain-containing protein [Clostridia bacterium]